MILFFRVDWTKRSQDIVKRGAVTVDGEVEYPGNGVEVGVGSSGDNNMEEQDPENEDSDHDDEDGVEGTGGGGFLLEDEGSEGVMKNRCDLLWQGIVARRVFHGFRFQVMSHHFVEMSYCSFL